MVEREDARLGLRSFGIVDNSCATIAGRSPSRISALDAFTGSGMEPNGEYAVKVRSPACQVSVAQP